MGISETLKAIQPLRGEVIPIRTVQETNPPEEFGDAYVAEVNVKAAAKVIKVLDYKYPRNPSLPLSHLRRFAKRENLPPKLRARIEANGSHEKATIKTIFVVIAPLPDPEELLELLAPFAPNTYKTGPSSPTSDSFAPTSPHPKIDLITVTIPLQPPFNSQQAETWTNTMWPVTFNPAAPRATVAPPLQILTRAHESLKPRAGYYVALAQKAAAEAKKSGRGRGVGAVVVDPAIEAEIEEDAENYGHSNLDRWMDAVLCVSEDVRFARSEAGNPSQTDLHPGVAPNPASSAFNADVEGGPDLHALMRAVELISRRRREETEHQAEMAALPNPMAVIRKDPQLSLQLSPMESYFLYEAEARAPLADEPSHQSNSNQPEPSPFSPKKRKAEEPNPESISAPLESTCLSPTNGSQNQDQPTTTSAPLPAPPPSTVTTLADPTIRHPHIEPADTSLATSSRIRTRSQGGYLCTDLDIYISHEPCLCCSMGLLLSRFRAVIFPRSGRMKSGGLASEPVVFPVADDEGKESSDAAEAGNDRLYYGLNWRKELNWRALGFEFVEDDEQHTVNSSEDEVDFHA
ncbi:hypothetical protein N7478_007930 [Penicillium angulare]|uniref:uncharacterized protein n=1 Tax=Penicillium angulare TaxID=116970 RepID=UPI00254196BA|nr:uncharacterized protein N7478_007930 [Penicillium angulare]KAJ5272805.1 hypothetical protein N7478_007930 [Penicillium angulare]